MYAQIVWSKVIGETPRLQPGLQPVRNCVDNLSPIRLRLRPAVGGGSECENLRSALSLAAHAGLPMHDTVHAYYRPGPARKLRQHCQSYQERNEFGLSSYVKRTGSFEALLHNVSYEDRSQSSASISITTQGQAEQVRLFPDTYNDNYPALTSRRVSPPVIAITTWVGNISSYALLERSHSNSLATGIPCTTLSRTQSLFLRPIASTDVLAPEISPVSSSRFCCDDVVSKPYVTFE
jgi:hypothetical protein